MVACRLEDCEFHSPKSSYAEPQFSHFHYLYRRDNVRMGCKFERTFLGVLEHGMLLFARQWFTRTAPALSGCVGRCGGIKLFVVFGIDRLPVRAKGG